MAEFQPVLWQAFCAVLGALILVLAWVGARIHAQLDKICTTLTEMKAEANAKHTDHEARIVRQETRCALEHGHAT